MSEHPTEKTIKIVLFGLLFFILAGLVINYVVFQMQTKSRASGETITLSFATASNRTSTTIQVKPTVNMSIRGYAFQIAFDPAAVVVKDISYKMGVVSAGLGDDNAQLAKINQLGIIKVQGEVQAASGLILQPSSASDVVTISIELKTTMPNVSIAASTVSFFVVNTDSTLSIVPASGNAQLNGTNPTGGATGAPGITSIATPSPTLVAATIAPQAMFYCNPSSKKCSKTTSIYGAIAACQSNLKEFLKEGSTGICYLKELDCGTACSTSTGSGQLVAATLNLKLKFQGVTKQPVAGASPLQVRLKIGNASGTATEYKTVAFSSDANGVWSGSADFTGLSSTGNIIYIKGPKHNQKKLCDQTPTESTPGTYSCSAGKIALQAGANNLDFTGVYQLVGDLPTQDGIVNSIDLALIRNNLGKSDAATLVFCDLNLDGTCDTQDYSAIISALSIRSDEQ